MIGLLAVLKDVTTRFDREGIEYFLVGSLAAMYYSRPRFTRDLDLVVRLPIKQVARLPAIFPIKEYYCPPKEILHDEIIRKGTFNLIHQYSGIKIDIVLDKETEFYRSEFSRKIKCEIAPQVTIFIASPEDIILKKLDFYREGQSEKHLNDIREILLETKIDNVYLEEWLDRLHLREEWGRV